MEKTQKPSTAGTEAGQRCGGNILFLSSPMGSAEWGQNWVWEMPSWICFNGLQAPIVKMFADEPVTLVGCDSLDINSLI